MVKLGDDALGAWFDEQGRLLGFVSRGQTWTLARPSSGWSAALRVDGVDRFASAGDTVRVEPLSAAHLRVSGQPRFEDGGAAGGRAVIDWHLADGLLQASLAISGLPAEAVLRELIVPDVTIAWRDGAATSLCVPQGLGFALRGAAEGLFAGRDKVALGATEFQCWGWSEGGRGLYFDTRDAEGHVKGWRFERVGERELRLRGVCPAPGDAPHGWALPYRVSLGGFDGSWYDLATVYRPWALAQPWAVRGPAERRDSYLADIAGWLWNRGRVTTVVPPALELARRVGLPLALDWYWWHQHGYDTEYPDYFPPRDGEAPFRAAVRALQAGGVRVQVYTNGMAADMDGGAWLPAGPDSALIQESGEPWAHAFNTFTRHRLALACGAAPAWHEVVSGFVARARELGLDGLYLDMIGNAGGYPACWSTAHGHAPGGGCYGVRGYRALLERLRAEQPGFPLTTEATREDYLDLVEGNIVLHTSAERWGWHHLHGCDAEVVPLFPAIYHGRCVMFGNYAFLDGIPPFDDRWPAAFRLDPAAERDWPALCPDQFAYEAARTVAFGCQPMICNLTAAQLARPELADDLAFCIALMRAYHAHREWLLWGDMLPPGQLDCPEVEIAFLQRYIFTKPGEERIAACRRPSLLHSAWRAGDGTARLLLTNPLRDEVTLRYIPPAAWRLAAPMGATLPARAIRLVPLEPEPGTPRHDLRVR